MEGIGRDGCVLALSSSPAKCRCHAGCGAGAPFEGLTFRGLRPESPRHELTVEDNVVLRKDLVTPSWLMMIQFSLAMLRAAKYYNLKGSCRETNIVEFVGLVE